MLNKIRKKHPVLDWGIDILIVVIVAALYAFTLNFFMVPGHIYSGGVMGFSQLLTYFLNNHTDIGNNIQAGTINLILNIPIIILGFIRLGRRFTTLTLMIVVGISIFSEMIPVTEISDNPLLNGVVGGALAGAAVGFAVKAGMSAGGTDIISLVLNQLYGVNVGSMNLMINFFVFVGAGFIYTWEFALFTLISMFTTSRVIDTIHTNDHRLTVFIVTQRAEEVAQSIFSELRRGITILDGKGGYTKTPTQVMMIVANRYELSTLEAAILEGDPKAFINIVQSTKVVGNYLSKYQQDKIRKEQTSMKSRIVG